MPASLHDAQSAAASHTHNLVRDLHTPDALVYWSDMLITAAVGWSAFTGAVLFRLWSWPMLTAFLVCALAVYRGLCFLHEITHLRSGALRGFEFAWNILFGMPLLIPSFMYVGVHQYHHNLATYGTDRDPEYLPFSGKPVMMILFIVQSLSVPLMLLVRFFLVVPAALIVPRFHRWIVVRFSALCLNVKFRRAVSDALVRTVRNWELLTVASWAAIGTVLVFSHRAGRCLVIWYAVTACVALVNTMRTLGAHRYSSDGEPLGRDEQLSDSIDTPGAFWTELWAPVGLRYHALHHYFPGIPYHNLGKAYRKLTENLPPDAFYHRSASPGLPHSIGALYRGYEPGKRADISRSR